MSTPRIIRGFTLVETLVAIAVLMLAMITPFYAVQQSLDASDSARDELIGNMLAQEGIEYVIDIRDNNYLNAYFHQGVTESWLFGLDGSNYNGVTSPNCYAPNKCIVDPTQSTVQTCSSNVCPVLYLSTSNLYNQSYSGAPTRFTRSIQLSTVAGSGSAHEVKVTSTVTWTTNHMAYTTSVSDYLQNWQPQ